MLAGLLGLLAGRLARRCRVEYVCGVDYASEPDGDYTATVVAAKRPEGTVEVVSMERVRNPVFTPPRGNARQRRRARRQAKAERFLRGS